MIRSSVLVTTILVIFLALEHFWNLGENDIGQYDDDFPKMLESLIHSGEIAEHIHYSKIQDMVLNNERRTSYYHYQHQHQFRHLQEQNTSGLPVLRPCNELIYTLSPTELKRIMFDYSDMLLPANATFKNVFEAWVDRTYIYGIKAYKLCASCTEFRETYTEMSDGRRTPFESYCGEGKHGADTDMSGLLTVPINDEGEFVEMESDLAIWSRWVEYHGSECPSEQFHNDTYWGNDIEALDQYGYSPISFLTTGLGIVTLIPDYFGFGESRFLDPTPSNKRGYQVSSVPLVLKARDTFLQEISGGRTSLCDKVISSGYSEGGMASIVTGDALHDLGFQVTTQSGGGSYDFTSVNSIFKVLLNPFYSTHRSLYVGWAASLSSTNPDLPNSNKNQDFLSEEWRDTVVGWFRTSEDNFEEPEIDAILNSLSSENYTKLYNPNVLDMVNEAFNTTGVEDICTLATENKTDLFCEALKLNEIKNDVAQAEHKTLLCWSFNDNIFPKEAHLPPFWTRFSNRHIRTTIIPDIAEPGQTGFSSGHTVAGGYCTLLFYLRFLTRFGL